ncbi:DNA pilot protein [robinz microvirus RP_188]|nr:DNA pilot protein [robinz microvirus RP_188]
MGFLSGLLGIAGGAIDAGIGAHTAKKQYGYQRALNDQQDDFNERMSNTQYQRGTQDMLKAGLNPALMFKSGGPDTASASSGGNAPDVSRAVGRPASQAISSARELSNSSQANAQAQNTQAQTDLTKANTANMVAKTAAEIKAMNSNTALNPFRQDNLISGSNLNFQTARMRRPDELVSQEMTQAAGLSTARMAAKLIREGGSTLGSLSPLKIGRK